MPHLTSLPLPQLGGLRVHWQRRADVSTAAISERRDGGSLKSRSEEGEIGVGGDPRRELQDELLGEAFPCRLAYEGSRHQLDAAVFSASSRVGAVIGT